MHSSSDPHMKVAAAARPTNQSTITRPRNLNKLLSQIIANRFLDPKRAIAFQMHMENHQRLLHVLHIYHPCRRSVPLPHHTWVGSDRHAHQLRVGSEISKKSSMGGRGGTSTHTHPQTRSQTFESRARLHAFIIYKNAGFSRVKQHETSNLPIDSCISVTRQGKLEVAIITSSKTLYTVIAETKAVTS